MDQIEYQFPLSGKDCDTLNNSSRENKNSKTSRYLNFKHTLTLIKPRKFKKYFNIKKLPVLRIIVTF